MLLPVPECQAACDSLACGADYIIPSAFVLGLFPVSTSDSLETRMFFWSAPVQQSKTAPLLAHSELDFVCELGLPVHASPFGETALKLRLNPLIIR